MPLQRQRPLSLRQIVSYSPLLCFRFGEAATRPFFPFAGFESAKRTVRCQDHSGESPETRARVCPVPFESQCVDGCPPQPGDGITLSMLEQRTAITCCQRWSFGNCRAATEQLTRAKIFFPRFVILGTRGVQRR